MACFNETKRSPPANIGESRYGTRRCYFGIQRDVLNGFTVVVSGGLFRPHRRRR